MDPGAKVPLHSQNGREYILVLDGSFCDEYGTYLKGNLQINDSKIKHTPVANAIEGCICLTITEDDLLFYGPFAPILNLFTFCSNDSNMNFSINLFASSRLYPCKSIVFDLTDFL